MDNPEKLATLGTQDEEKLKKNPQHNIQLVTFHKVDTVIYQPRGSDVHRSQRLR
jgi:hypothetical protein